MSRQRPWRNKSTEKSKEIPTPGVVTQGVSAITALSESLEDNLALLQSLFHMDNTFVTRPIQRGDNPEPYYIAYCEGLVDATVINEHIIKPLIDSKIPLEGENLLDTLIKQVILVSGINKSNDLDQLVDSITYGDTVLLVPGVSEALLLDTKRFYYRSIEEPEGEKILSGPREGFTESLIQNLSLVRRRLRTHNFKVKFLTFGKYTRTQACICYLDGIVNESILAEFERRLSTVDIDGVLDSNYIAEITRDSSTASFRSTGYTERPDVVVGKLLEGRIALLLDGTPVALTVPYLFIENFQSNEDYYLNFYYASFARLLRILGFILTITVPGLYVAIVAFHHEMLPTPLLINIAMEQQSVPLPAALEATIMLIIFEVLRETGVRMPSNTGQALSIVGALVIGQAAVEAKLVAAPLIIVVGLTGITSLLVPKINAPIVFIRFLLLFAASAFGIYGFFLGLAAVFVHLLNLKSYGVPQLTPEVDLKYQELKDTVIRAPWWTMFKRPRKLTKNQQRMATKDGDTGD